MPINLNPYHKVSSPPSSPLPLSKSKNLPARSTNHFDTIQSASPKPQAKSPFEIEKDMVTKLKACFLAIKGFSLSTILIPFARGGVLSNLGSAIGFGISSFSLAELANSAASWFKSPTRFWRNHRLISNLTSLGQTCSSASMTLTRMGLAAANMTAALISQIVFAGIGLIFSLFSFAKANSYQNLKNELSQLDINSPSLADRIQETVKDYDLFSFTLKDILTSDKHVQAYEKLVNEQPQQALNMLRKISDLSSRLALVEAFANTLLGVGSLAFFTVPAAGIAITAVGGLFYSIYWVWSTVAFKKLGQELQDLSAIHSMKNPQELRTSIAIEESNN